MEKKEPNFIFTIEEVESLINDIINKLKQSSLRWHSEIKEIIEDLEGRLR